MITGQFPRGVAVEDCRCCGGSTSEFSSAKILDFVANYEKCNICQSVQVANPSWIAEAHKKAISNLDTGLVTRCVSASRLIATLLFLESQIGAKGVDWGGGTGLLTRLLRDQGFHAKSYDKYANNEHAEGFTATLENAEDSAVFLTAIECFEHLVNPIESFQLVTAKKKYFIFTTEIIDTPPPDPATRSWWYFMPESGQHITFASEKGIQAFTRILGFDHYIRFGSIHVMSRSKCKPWTRIVLSTKFIRGIMILVIPELLSRKYSLTVRDKEELTGA